MPKLRIHANSILVSLITITLLSYGILPGNAQILELDEEPPTPQMGDVSHSLMAEHASSSYGLTNQQVEWVSQGAWDEDHCAVNPYPPAGPLCFPAIPSGHHSWDPDTNMFWDEPAWWGDFGSALRRAKILFNRAVAAYQNGQQTAAYLWLGRSMHLLGDMATPAHVLLDTHLPGDSDKYEAWLSAGGQEKTLAWISANPPGSEWSLEYHHLPTWGQLSEDLRAELDQASLLYGGRASGQELWQLGPEEEDPVIFRIMYLIAEQADNWDSNDFSGELNHGQLDDEAYLLAIRDALFPILTRQSTALISYFHQNVLLPQAPTLISPADGALVPGDFLQLQWHPVGVNPEYYIQVATQEQFDQPLVDESTLSSTFTIKEILSEGTYYWRVRATSKAGESEWSRTWTFNVMWRMSLPVICRDC